MLKTISAALLAVSVLAAPALAAGTDKTAQAPVTKSAPVKQSAVNANAKMGRHHVRHASHHRFHKKMATHKAASVLEDRSQARDAPRQARLTPIRRERLDPLAPPLPADIRSGPRRVTPMALGRRCIMTGICMNAEMQIPFHLRKV